jgi:GrpB-like predicted nucleotidyltransferase (UPF0157 family)
VPFTFKQKRLCNLPNKKSVWYAIYTMAAVIGLKRGTVALKAHSRLWAKLFEQEKKRLRRVLGKTALDIQDVGSTAVPGLVAKPIIDIAVGLNSLKNGRELAKIMEKGGYVYRPKWGRLDQHILFARGDEKSRTHYIHLVKYNGAIWKHELQFRNYLRSHSTCAKRYGELKTKLANKYPNDRRFYTVQKGEFIADTLRRIQ